MNHLKEAKLFSESTTRETTNEGAMVASLISITHALITIAEQLQAGNSEPSPAADWFTINDGSMFCRFCGIRQPTNLWHSNEKHKGYCQRGQWVKQRAQPPLVG